jgi:hypothetical protein
VRVLWEDRALADLEASQTGRRGPPPTSTRRCAGSPGSGFRRLAIDRPEHVLSVPPYIVIYRVDGDDLSVLALEDARQRREEW